MCVFGTEKLGIPVWGISKLLNCLFYKDTIFFPYFFVVYIFGGRSCKTSGSDTFTDNRVFSYYIMKKKMPQYTWHFLHINYQKKRAYCTEN